MSIEPLDLTNRFINSSQDNLRFEAGVKWYFSKVEPYGLAFNCQENLVNHSQKHSMIKSCFQNQKIIYWLVGSSTNKIDNIDRKSLESNQTFLWNESLI